MSHPPQHEVPGTVTDGGPTDLRSFLSAHREQIILQARAKVKSRAVPFTTPHELANGVPLFLTQLGEILGQEASQDDPDGSAMATSATQHGKDLLDQGFSISQVVHDYGDICQAVTELAVDLRAPISTEDFRTLNRCLDNAIAGAVTGYSLRREVNATGEERRKDFFAHELRNHLNTATLAFQVVKSGKVGLSGSTIGVLERSLRALRELVDRSLTEVRLAAGKHHRVRVRVAEFIEQMEIDASLEAEDRELRLMVEQVDNHLMVEVDQHLFTSAISNLLQNAFKFTRPSGRVSLRVRARADRVAIEIEDECGGLKPGVEDAFFKRVELRGSSPTGLGLGLAISRQAIETDGGTISLRDLPGRGCVFVVEMPLAPAVAEPPKG